MTTPRYSKEDRQRRQAAVQTVHGGLLAGLGVPIAAEGAVLHSQYRRLGEAHRENADAYTRMARSYYRHGDPISSAIHLAQVPKHKAAAQTAARLGRGIGLPVVAGGSALAALGATKVARGLGQMHENRKEFGKSELWTWIAKAEEQQQYPKASFGRLASGAFAPGFHGAVAGREGHKTRAALNEALPAASAGLVGMGLAGPRLGYPLGTLASGFGTRRAQRKGHYQPQLRRVVTYQPRESVGKADDDSNTKRNTAIAGGGAVVGGGALGAWLLSRRKKSGMTVPGADGPGPGIMSPKPTPMLPPGGSGGTTLHGFTPTARRVLRTL